MLTTTKTSLLLPFIFCFLCLFHNQFKFSFCDFIFILQKKKSFPIFFLVFRLNPSYCVWRPELFNQHATAVPIISEEVCATYFSACVKMIKVTHTHTHTHRCCTLRCTQLVGFLHSLPLKSHKTLHDRRFQWSKLSKISWPLTSFRINKWIRLFCFSVAMVVYITDGVITWIC